MKLDQQLLADLSRIPWFDKCGSLSGSFAFPVRQLSDWWEVKSAFSDDWINQTDEAQGQLTEYLSSRHARFYQGIWSKLVKEARPCVEATAGVRALAVSSVNGLGKPFVDSVKWDVLNAVMEISYKTQNPPVFFSRLFDVYRAGHFPCGMDKDGTILFI